MKTSLLITISLLGCGLAKALPDGQTLANINWDDLINGTPQGLQLPPQVTGTIDNPTNSDNPSMAELKLQYSGTSPLQLKLLPTPFSNQSIGFPRGVSRLVTHHYAITGEVRYENVSPGSYLEMWSYFDSPAPGYPEGAFFSRTMADSGPMGKLDGTSDWREFWLPFDATSTTATLNRLEMNLHLTGPGTVHLRNMKLMQYPDAPATATSLPADSSAVHLVPPSAVDDARAAFTVAQNQYSAGTGDYLSVLEAGQHFHWAEAMFAGDSIAAAKVNRDGAKARLELMQKEYRAGTLDYARFASVQNELAAAEASLNTLQSVFKQAGASAPSTTSETSFAKVGAIVEVEQTKALKTIWFCLGVATTTMTLLVITGFIFVSRLWQRRHHERELRRIASLDS